jgi:hypothetical protein
MNTFYLVEGQVGSYFITAIGDTARNALVALEKTYLKNDCQNWKTGQTFAEWVDYQGIRPRELKLNQAEWH